MTDQPPAQPPAQSPAQSPAQLPQAAPKTKLWHQATSTRGGRWAIAVAAGALACLMLLGIGLAGLAVLRNHDRFNMMGQRQDGYSRDQGDKSGQGNGRGMPGAPGMRGGRTQGLGGFGGLLGGTALHGTVTATANGSVQALVLQRGEVTAVSATSITLKSSDGFVGTYGRTAATSSMRAVPVKGGQAFVLARASDKVAITIMSTPTKAGVGSSN